MHIRRLVLLLVLAISAALGASSVGAIDPSATAGPPPSAEPLGPAAPVDPWIADRLDASLAAQRLDINTPALVAAMRLPDGRIWMGAVGKAEVGKGGQAATVRTPFVIGSITKSFVAALALQLQEQGLLSLDDPISTWLPEYPNGAAITLRMLLSHRSGIFDYFWHPDYQSLVFDRPTHNWTTDEILALTGASQFPPGRGYGYSNTNYILAGKIVSMVGGEPLGQLIRERFLDPLGLADTVFQGEEDVPEGAARGYLHENHQWLDQSDGTPYRPNTSAATVAWAAGAMLSSAVDLLRWEGALYDGTILSPESMAQLLDFSPDSGYGLATRRQTLAGRKGFGHGGSLRGFVAVMYRVPDPGIDVVVFTNRGWVDLDTVAGKLVRIALATPPETPATPTAIPEANATAVP